MRIAVIADTHGNRHALDAVLRSIRADRPDMVVNLGDLVSGPFDPAGSADDQIGLDCPTLAGNHERQLLMAENTGESDAVARSSLSDAHLRWIAALPRTLSLLDGAVFACHGSPAGGDLDYLLEDVSTGRPALRSDHAIRDGLAGIGDARLVLCAHTHVPRIVRCGDTLIVNPGSVGLPAYRDDRPVPHAMQAGSPHARYALLTGRGSGWDAALRAVAYDAEAAARLAEQHRRPDVAFAVRTGRAVPVDDVRSG